MRRLWIAALAACGLIAATSAEAQQVRSSGPVYYNSSAGTPRAPFAQRVMGQPIPAPQSMSGPPRMSHNPPHYNPPRQNPPRYNPPRHNPPNANPPRHHGGRWGERINGRWWGGSKAPGGWGGYRRPSRGWTLPRYWMGGNFFISDFHNFGLRQPDYGYNWVRYYDDAVLVDNHGRVQDWAGGVNWDEGDDAYAYAEDGYASASASAYASSGADYPAPIQQGDPNQYYGYPGGYAPPAQAMPPAVQYGGCPQTCPNPGGYYGSYQGGGHQGGYQTGYYAGGYYYPGATTTTIVVQPAMSTTTTVIEEVIEETTTTYVSRPKRVYRAKAKPKRRPCTCQCVCR